jgi:hypothetical protein
MDSGVLCVLFGIAVADPELVVVKVGVGVTHMIDTAPLLP